MYFRNTKIYFQSTKVYSRSTKVYSPSTKVYFQSTSILSNYTSILSKNKSLLWKYKSILWRKNPKTRLLRVLFDSIDLLALFGVYAGIIFQGFIHPRWCRISSINSSTAILQIPKENGNPMPRCCGPFFTSGTNNSHVGAKTLEAGFLRWTARKTVLALCLQ